MADDLPAATAFVVVLGLKLQGEPVEGSWVDRVVGLVAVRAEIVQTPDGHGRLKLTEFHAPSGRAGDPHPEHPGYPPYRIRRRRRRRRRR